MRLSGHLVLARAMTMLLAIVNARAMCQCELVALVFYESGSIELQIGFDESDDDDWHSQIQSCHQVRP